MKFHLCFKNWRRDCFQSSSKFIDVSCFSQLNHMSKLIWLLITRRRKCTKITLLVVKIFCCWTPGYRRRSVLNWGFTKFHANVNTHQHLAARRTVKGNESVIWGLHGFDGHPLWAHSIPFVAFFLRMSPLLYPSRVSSVKITKLAPLVFQLSHFPWYSVTPHQKNKIRFEFHVN
jgi:hypothetical protein